MVSCIYACLNIYMCDHLRMLKAGDLFDVGDIVRKLRILAGIKGPKQIKSVLRVNKATLSRIENTSHYDKDAIERIAAGLGVSVAEILLIRDSLRNTAPAPIQDAHAYVCSNPDHKKLHRLLDEILEGKRDDAHEWRAGIIANLKAMRLAAIVGDIPPELKNATRWTRKPVPRKKGNEGV